MAKKSYSLASNYLKDLPIFNYLTQKEKDSLAYNMYSLKYEK
jgi:hypothetical protein